MQRCQKGGAAKEPTYHHHSFIQIEDLTQPVRSTPHAQNHHLSGTLLPILITVWPEDIRPFLSGYYPPGHATSAARVELLSTSQHQSAIGKLEVGGQGLCP